MKFRALNWDYHGDAKSLLEQRQSSTTVDTTTVWLREGHYERERQPWNLDSSQPKKNAETTTTIKKNESNDTIQTNSIVVDSPEHGISSCMAVGANATTVVQLQCQPILQLCRSLSTPAAIQKQQQQQQFFSLFGLNHNSGLYNLLHIHNHHGRYLPHAPWLEALLRQLWQTNHPNNDHDDGKNFNKSQPSDNIMFSMISCLFVKYPSWQFDLQPKQSEPTTTKNNQLMSVATNIIPWMASARTMENPTTKSSVVTMPLFNQAYSYANHNFSSVSSSSASDEWLLFLNSEQKQDDDTERTNPTSSVTIEELERVDTTVEDKIMVIPDATTVNTDKSSILDATGPTNMSPKKKRTRPNSAGLDRTSDEYVMDQDQPPSQTHSILQDVTNVNVTTTNYNRGTATQKFQLQLPSDPGLSKEDDLDLLYRNQEVDVMENVESSKKKHKRSTEERKAHKKERKALKRERKRKRQEEKENEGQHNTTKQEMYLPRRSIVQTKKSTSCSNAEDELHMARTTLTKTAHDHRKAFSQLQIPPRKTATPALALSLQISSASADMPQSVASEQHRTWMNSLDTNEILSTVFPKSSIDTQVSINPLNNDVASVSMVVDRHSQERLPQPGYAKHDRGQQPSYKSGTRDGWKLRGKSMHPVAGATSSILPRMDTAKSFREDNDYVQVSHFQSPEENNIRSHGMAALQEKTESENIQGRQQETTIPKERFSNSYHDRHLSTTERPSHHTINTQVREEYALQPAESCQAQQKLLPVPCASNLPALNFLCSENFLENWGYVVAELASGSWAEDQTQSSHANMGGARRKINLIDTPLVGASGVDIETPGRCGYLVYATSALLSSKEAKQIVMEVAELASIGRYSHLKIWLCHDVPVNLEITKHIVQLQCSVLDISGNPPTTVSFKTATQKSLSHSLAVTMLKIPKSPPNSVLLQEQVIQCVHDKRIQERSLFLLSLMPLLSANGAIQCLLLAKKLLPPGSPSFRMLFQNQRLRQQIMLHSNSESFCTELHPAAMLQLSRILQLGSDQK